MNYKNVKFKIITEAHHNDKINIIDSLYIIEDISIKKVGVN